MTSNRDTLRQKLLYGALAVIGVLYVGDVGYRKLYEEPIQNADRKFSGINERLKKQKLSNAKAKQAVKQVDKLQVIALPRNLEMARSTYQSWLLQLVNDCQLDAPKVDSSSPAPFSYRRQLLYNRFTFTLRGRGNLHQVTQFLHRFYSADHLHKIQSLSLAPSGGKLDMNASIEALSLPGANRESKLSEQTADRLAFADLSSYRRIASRNLFQSSGDAAGRSVYLSAITTDRMGNREAWFYNVRSEKTEKLEKGGAISVGGATATIVEILESSALLRIDDELFRIPMGTTFAEAEQAEPL